MTRDAVLSVLLGSAIVFWASDVARGPAGALQPSTLNQIRLQYLEKDTVHVQKVVGIEYEYETKTLLLNAQPPRPIALNQVVAIVYEHNLPTLSRGREGDFFTVQFPALFSGVEVVHREPDGSLRVDEAYYLRRIGKRGEVEFYGAREGKPARRVIEGGAVVAIVFPRDRACTRGSGLLTFRGSQRVSSVALQADYRVAITWHECEASTFVYGSERPLRVD